MSANHKKKKSQPGMTAINNTHESKIESNPPEPIDASQRKPFFFYLILILIPFLFFVLLETALRLFNYGTDIPQWYPASEKKYILNPDIARRYFASLKEVPTSNHDVFDKVKTVNSFRIFVLGESSGAGYPYLPLGSFSGYLKERMKLVYPGINVEVVNLSMTAINTYALRDMMPGVIEQKPDLVLIYTGHNEYYGALGVNSMGLIGSSPSLVNLYIKLSRFKTVELLSNIIRSAAGIFAGGKDTDPNATLMSRMAAGGQIPFGTSQYKAGVKQFESNMKAILEMARENHVPVIIGTLTSNLKDQPPLSWLQNEKDISAFNLYQKAKTELEKRNYHSALELFRKSRDLDAVRFRAPEEINQTIKKLGSEFNFPVADVDSLFNSLSPGGITGDNLMTDHLHPNLKGYQQIGKLFFEVMKKNSILPKTMPASYEDSVLDRLAVDNYGFSSLDSTIAHFRITALKNDWPFVQHKDKKPLNALIKIENYFDTLAFQVCFEGVPWVKSHRMAAEWCLKRKDFSGFEQMMSIIIKKYPAVTEFYTHMIDQLLLHKQYDIAFKHLENSNNENPDAYTLKWLGLISLYKGKFDDAVKFLNLSRDMNARDAQVLYNLAGAYVNKNDYEKAYLTINECLKIDPGFPGAADLRNQLASAVQ